MSEPMDVERDVQQIIWNALAAPDCDTWEVARAATLAVLRHVLARSDEGIPAVSYITALIRRVEG